MEKDYEQLKSEAVGSLRYLSLFVDDLSLFIDRVNRVLDSPKPDSSDLSALSSSFDDRAYCVLYRARNVRGKFEALSSYCEVKEFNEASDDDASDL